jgi:hypothetical protein
MPALFPRRSNTLFRLVAGSVILAIAGSIAALLIGARSPLLLGQDRFVQQPIDFDHRHHVADVGIDCRYCHAGVETSAWAGVPGPDTCMNCHGQVWNKSAILEPLRDAWSNGRTIAWNRVNRLPDFVYFNHAIHVNKGVGCATCHGRVDRMPVVEQTAPLTMGWCLDCHRNPAPNLRPKEYVTSMDWQPGKNAEELGYELMARYDVQPRTSCTTCHR